MRNTRRIRATFTTRMWSCRIWLWNCSRRIRHLEITTSRVALIALNSRSWLVLFSRRKWKFRPCSTTTKTRAAATRDPLANTKLPLTRETEKMKNWEPWSTKWIWRSNRKGKNLNQLKVRSPKDFRASMRKTTLTTKKGSRILKEGCWICRAVKEVLTKSRTYRKNWHFRPNRSPISVTPSNSKTRNSPNSETAPTRYRSWSRNRKNSREYRTIGIDCPRT